MLHHSSPPVGRVAVRLGSNSITSNTFVNHYRTSTSTGEAPGPVRLSRPTLRRSVARSPLSSFLPFSPSLVLLEIMACQVALSFSFCYHLLLLTGLLESDQSPSLELFVEMTNPKKSICTGGIAGRCSHLMVRQAGPLSLLPNLSG